MNAISEAAPVEDPRERIKRLQEEMRRQSQQKLREEQARRRAERIERPKTVMKQTVRKSDEELESYAGGAPEAAKPDNSGERDAETAKMFESHEAELEKLTRKPAEAEGFWARLKGHPLDKEA